MTDVEYTLKMIIFPRRTGYRAVYGRRDNRLHYNVGAHYMEAMNMLFWDNKLTSEFDFGNTVSDGNASQNTWQMKYLE